MLINPSFNFLSWYKDCCLLDFCVYKKINFNHKKAKIFYSVAINKDFAIYPLNGSEKMLFGTKDFCENSIQKDINVKYMVFSIKKDQSASYYFKNELVKID